MAARFIKSWVGIAVAFFVALFVFSAVVGVWIPDVVWPRRHVVALETSPGGDVARVVQFWNRGDFYTTEFEFIGTNGVVRSFVLDGDDAKAWSLRMEVNWMTKVAVVTLGGGRKRTIDWTQGNVDWHR